MAKRNIAGINEMSIKIIIIIPYNYYYLCSK